MEEQQEKTVCGSERESISGAVKIPAQYEIQSVLGQGGMGVVYRAHDRETDRDVAIKVLSFEGSRISEVQQRFLKEARLLGSSEHPNIVRIYSSGLTEDGDVYQVMELIHGVSLAHRLKHGGKMGGAEFSKIFSQVTSGLQYLHERGIVHRDLKPGNIMLSGRESSETDVRIIDLGIARTLESLDSNTLTQTNAVLGSPSYMSPEQCAGQKVEGASDIYSLGCIMFECLTGAPPFSGESALAVMQKHLYEKAPQLSVSAKEASSRELYQLVETCMDKNPAKRPISMADVRAQLESICKESDLDVVLDRGERRKAFPFATVIATFLLTLVTGVSFFAFKKPMPVEQFTSTGESGLATGDGVVKIKVPARGTL